MSPARGPYARRVARAVDLLHVLAAACLSLCACDALVGESFSGYRLKRDARAEASESSDDGGLAAADADPDARLADYGTSSPDAPPDSAPAGDVPVDAGGDDDVNGEGNGDADAADGTGPDIDAPRDATIVPLFPFRPSNVAVEQLRLSSNSAQLGDAVLDSNDCAISSLQTPKVIMCTVAPSVVAPLEGVVWMAVRSGDGPPVDVFIARSWVVSNRAALPLYGRTVLVALGDIVIAGALTAGGADTAEPGAGPGGDSTAGGGGGSFCGRGGAGAHSTGTPGAAYGTPDLVPPRVGSAGGGSPWASSGGGFLHLLAGGKVTVTASGRVSAPGGGGYSWGGGGSGGAVLIEATSIAIHGVVAANGGGGGGALGRVMGQAGAASAAGASGGLDDDNAVIGGQGGAGTNIDGQNAVASAPSAGGGGGVGRIRLNSRNQQLTVDGTLSPPLSTTCASAGQVQDP